MNNSQTGGWVFGNFPFITGLLSRDFIPLDGFSHAASRTLYVIEVQIPTINAHGFQDPSIEVQFL